MKVLIVVDMQNDFITGSLGSADACKIVDNVSKKIASCKNDGYKIVFTRDTHFDDYLSTFEGIRLPVKHCIKDSQGWQIADTLDTSGCEIIDKYTFGSDKLADIISQHGNPEQIELVGLCTDICVISCAMLIRCNFPETPVSIDASCCAGTSAENHKNALSAMKMCMIDIVKEQSV